VRKGSISRRINDALAEIVAKHPKRFGAIATVPGKTIDGSLSEMGYVEDNLLGRFTLDPWFEEMNHCKVTLFMRPMELSRAAVQREVPGTHFA